MSLAKFQSESGSQRILSPVLQIALLVGVTAHLIGFLVFRVKTKDLPNRQPEPAFVQYVSPVALADDSALRERAELMDSAPLFIPTRWNAAQELVTTTRDRLSQTFPPFEPQIDLLRALKPESLMVTLDSAVDRPADLLALRYWQIFKDFAVVAPKPVALPAPRPVAEVMRLGGHGIEAPLGLTLNGDALKTAGAQGPVHYYLRLNGAGQLVAAPALYQSSGSVDFDAAVAKWLQLDTTLGQLPAGHLSVRVYPDL